VVGRDGKTGCNQGVGPTQSGIHVFVEDPPNKPETLIVRIVFMTASGVTLTKPLLMHYGGKYFDVTLGPISYLTGASGSIEADVVATDKAGNQSKAHLIRLTWLNNCFTNPG
jgi:hypothetical protein